MKMNLTAESYDQHRIVRLISAFACSLTVTLPANAAVLWLILRGSRLAPDIFYANLSSGEILFSASIFWAYFGFQGSCTYCSEAFAFFCGLFYTGRPLFQCLICLECYMGVNRPVLFLRLKPLRYRLSCCAVGWLVIAISCIYSYCTRQNRRHLFTIFIQNLFFLFAVLFCLVSVLRTLKRPGPGGHNAQKKSNRAKTRAMKILLVTMGNMTLNFLLCMAPIPLQLCLPRSEFLYVYVMCTCLSFITGSTQPLIYLQRAEKVLCLRLH